MRGPVRFRSWPPGAWVAVATVIDAVVFIATLRRGMQISAAQILSFGVATTLTLAARVRGGSARSRASAGDWEPAPTGGWQPACVRTGDFAARLVCVLLLALFLRGGVLGLTLVWGWPPQVAIWFAALSAALLSSVGIALAASTSWSLGQGTGWRTMAVAVVAAAFLLRLLYSGQIELLPEETYYWNYGQHLDLSYLDHPPMVAWLIRLGTAVCGNTEFGVRIGALCACAVASFFVYRLTRELSGQASALVALLLMQVLPFFFLAGMLTTPDAPLTAAWAAALYFLEQALLAGRGRAWLWAGFCIGVGLISKYTIGMLIPAALLFVLIDRSSRHWLARWEPYAAVAIASVIFAPVIIWNARHEWASFTFQTARRLAESPRFSLHKLLLSIIVLLTPAGLATLLVREPASAGTAQSDARRQSRARLLLGLTVLVPLLVFGSFSLRHDVKIDWTGASWLAAVPVLAGRIISFGNGASGRLRAFLHASWMPTVWCLLLMYGAGLLYLSVGLPAARYSEHTELVPEGWRALAAQTDELAAQVRAETGTQPLVVGMDRYETASELAFYSANPAAAAQTRTTAHLFGKTGLMYERWFPLAQQTGRTLILIAWDRRDLSDQQISPYVDRLGPIQQGILSRGEVPIRPYYYRIVYGYHMGGSIRP